MGTAFFECRNTAMELFSTIIFAQNNEECFFLLDVHKAHAQTSGSEPSGPIRGGRAAHPPPRGARRPRGHSAADVEEPQQLVQVEVAAPRSWRARAVRALSALQRENCRASRPQCGAAAPPRMSS